MTTDLQAVPPAADDDDVAALDPLVAVEAPVAPRNTDSGAAADRLEDARREAVRRAKHHRFMLWVAAIVILGMFSLEVRPDQRVTVRGFPALVLPESCGSKIAFGIECPGCGLTRSFIWAARGEWSNSLAVNRVGFLVMLAVVGQIPYRLAMLGRFRRGEPMATRWPKLFGSCLIAALFINWALKLLGL